MRKSDLLRVQDIRDAYRLIGDCRDLGSESALWQRRMLVGLCQLVGASIATSGEGFWVRPTHPIQPLSAFGIGFDAFGRERYMAYLREIGPQRDLIFRALTDVPGRVLTRTRSVMISDAVWYRSADFNDYRKPAGVDHSLVSLCQVSQQGAIAAIALDRGLGETDFSPGEVRLLEFFHEELGRLIGRQLVSATEPSPEKLSPRLRQTLACLVEGDRFFDPSDENSIPLFPPSLFLPLREEALASEHLFFLVIALRFPPRVAIGEGAVIVVEDLPAMCWEERDATMPALP